MQEGKVATASSAPSGVEPLGLRIILFVIFSLAALVWLAYANAITWHELHLDDRLLINQSIVVKPAFSEELRNAVFHEKANNRPVVMFSFVVNAWISGLSPEGFRIGNVLIHILAALICFFLVRRLLSLPRALQDQWHPGKHWSIAWLIAAIWALHPLQTESVTYICQRITALSGLFVMLALYLWLRALESENRTQRITFGIATGIAAMLAFGSKEVGILLLPSMGLMVWLLGRPGPHKTQGVQNSTKITFIVVGALAMLGLALLYMGDLTTKILSAYTETPEYRLFNGYERVLTQFRVLGRYIGEFLLPLPSVLNLDHDIDPSHNLVDPFSTLIAILFVLATLVGAWLLRKRHPLLAYGVLFFFLHHAIESLFPDIELMFEHRNYLPILGLVIVVIMSVRALGRRLPQKLLATVAIILCCTLAGLTYARNLVWETRIGLLEDRARKSPDKFRPNANLSAILHDEYLERSERGELSMEQKQTYIARGKLYATRADEARKNRPMRYPLRNSQPSFMLSLWAFEAGDYPQALAYALEAEKLGYPMHDLWLQLGASYYFCALSTPARETAYLEQSETCYRKYLTTAKDPKGRSRANFGIFHVLARRGDHSRSLELLREVLRLEPRHVDAMVELGLYYRRNGNAADAEKYFRAGLAINPSHPESLVNLGGLLLESPSQRAEAVAYLERFLSLYPHRPEAASIQDILGRTPK